MTSNFKMFAIVEFKSTESVAVIPTSWFNGQEEDKCHWPKSTDPMRITRLVSKMSDADSTWPVYEIKVLGKAVSYKRAREKLVDAEYTSNLDTDVEQQARKKRKTARYVSSDSDSDPEESMFSHASIPAAPEALLSSSRNYATSSHHNTLSHQPTASQHSQGSNSRQQLSPFPSTTPDRQPLQSSTPSLRTEPSVLSRESILRRIFSVLEDIKTTQKIHTAKLNDLERRLSNGSGPKEDFQLPDGVSFPMTSKEDLQEMELRCQEEGFQKGLTTLLSEFGGRTIDEVVKRIMVHIISNTFATGVNISGRSGKVSFGNTRLINIVYRAVKRNSKFAECSKKDVEVSIAKWLIGSRDRTGNRKKRLDRIRTNDPQEVEEEVDPGVEQVGDHDSDY